MTKNNGEFVAGEDPPDFERIGKGVRFFEEIQVLGVKVKADHDLVIGDTIFISDKNGKLTSLKISSMQVDNRPVTSASGGDKVAIFTGRPVYRRAVIFRKKKKQSYRRYSFAK